MSVAMMMRVSGRMIQVRPCKLQGVRISVMMMVTITKALLPMTNMMKIYIMLQNVVSHWSIQRTHCVGVRIELMRTMSMMKIELMKGSMRQ